MSIRDKVTDSRGRNVVAGLFKEFARSDIKFKPVYSLKEVKQIFLDCRDPSEYSAAMTIVGDWDHWQAIRNHPWIKPHVDKWQEELAIKLRSEAIRSMVEHSKQQGGTAAAKWLADKGYIDGVPVKKVGRPSSKIEPPPEPDRSGADAVRLGLVVGGKK